MKKERVKTVIWLLVISVAVFFGVQILMLYNSYELEKNKFIFLRQSLASEAFFQLNPYQKEIELLSIDLLSNEKNPSPENSLALIKQSLKDYENFGNILDKTFKENGINVKYEYTIMLKKYYIFQNPVEKKAIYDNNNFDKRYLISGTNMDIPNLYSSYSFYLKGEHYFLEVVLFIKYPGETLYIFGRMAEVLVVSFISTLIVFGIFFYTMRTILKQKKLSEMKSDFINNITHEFNTPLNTVKVAGANLKNERTKKSPEEVERLADIIIRQNNRLQKLIEDVMNASVLEEEKLSLNYTGADICELVNTAAADIKIKYEESGIEFVVNSPAELKCQCDEFQIMTAVYNIIDNAAKYSPENSKIEVEIKQDGKFVSLSVTDHGIGISENDRKHIFEKFFRTRTGKFTSVKGLGLGLYFVKKIIDAHSGEIEVLSSPGKGSTFIIHLPAVK